MTLLLAEDADERTGLTPESSDAFVFDPAVIREAIREKCMRYNADCDPPVCENAVDTMLHQNTEIIRDVTSQADVDRCLIAQKMLWDKYLNEWEQTAKPFRELSELASSCQTSVDIVRWHIRMNAAKRTASEGEVRFHVVDYIIEYLNEHRDALPATAAA